MAYSRVSDHYDITPAPIRCLSDEEYHHHNFHYKQGGQNFECWLRVVRSYVKPELHLNYLPTMAAAFVRDHGGIPEEPLYDLSRWLRGRQVCYCHHLLGGNADETHLHPIAIARKLIRILVPRECERIIAECTPDNLGALIQELGSEKAQEIYRDAQQPTNIMSAHLDNCHPDGFHSILEHEQKKRRMSSQSWRRPSISSDDESRSRTSSFSSSTSVSSLGSWRARSQSPKVTVNTRKDFASAVANNVAVNATTTTATVASTVAGTAIPTTATWGKLRATQSTESLTSTRPHPGKLVLKTKTARSHSNSR